MNNQPAYMYHVTLTQEDCLGKRVVSFPSEYCLTWEQVVKEVLQHFTSQTCARCKKNHKDDTYVATEIERGELGRNGDRYWRELFPRQSDYYNPQRELRFNG